MSAPAVMYTMLIELLLDALPSRRSPLVRRDRDRGAVSIEQVLWYAAAAVSVAVVAAIIWNQIKSTASTGVDTPSAP